MKRILIVFILLLLILTACPQTSDRNSGQKEQAVERLLPDFANEPQNTETPVYPILPGQIVRTELGSFYLPRSFGKNKLYTLIVLLHPMTNQEAPTIDQDEELFLAGHNWRDMAEKMDYILCSVKSQRYYWDESLHSKDMINIRNMILAMKVNFPVRPDKVCLFGFTYLTNTMLLANKGSAPGERLFNVFITAYGGSGFVFDHYLYQGAALPELKIPGLIFWGKIGPISTAKNVAEFLSSRGWDITAWEHEGWNYVQDRIIYRALAWLEKKIP